MNETLPLRFDETTLKRRETLLLIRQVVINHFFLIISAETESRGEEERGSFGFDLKVNLGSQAHKIKLKGPLEAM